MAEIEVVSLSPDEAPPPHESHVEVHVYRSPKSGAVVATLRGAIDTSNKSADFPQMPFGSDPEEAMVAARQVAAKYGLNKIYLRDTSTDSG